MYTVYCRYIYKIPYLRKLCCCFPWSYLWSSKHRKNGEICKKSTIHHILQVAPYPRRWRSWPLSTFWSRTAVSSEPPAPTYYSCCCFCLPRGQILPGDSQLIYTLSNPFLSGLKCIVKKISFSKVKKYISLTRDDYYEHWVELWVANVGATYMLNQLI